MYVNGFVLWENTIPCKGGRLRYVNGFITPDIDSVKMVDQAMLFDW